MKAVRVVAGIALLVALVAVAAAALSLAVNRPKSYAHQLAALHSEDVSLSRELSAANGQIAALKASSQAGAVSALRGDMSGLQAQMSKLTLCIPEMQQEINGMTVQTSNTGGYLTTAYISDPTIVSSDCQSTLFPPSTAGH
jgi:hypothetical protein